MSETHCLDQAVLQRVRQSSKIQTLIPGAGVDFSLCSSVHLQEHLAFLGTHFYWGTEKNARERHGFKPESGAKSLNLLIIYSP